MLTTITILVVAGLAALVLEVFLPGGVVGAAGALALAAAIVLVFFADSLGWPLGARALAALGILLVSISTFVVCMKNFHRTGLGRSVNLSETSGHRNEAAHDERESLIGTEGTAVTPLHPSGKALIAGKKWDVVCESGAAARDQPVVVTRTDGGTLYVRRLMTPASDSSVQISEPV